MTDRVENGNAVMRLSAVLVFTVINGAAALASDGVSIQWQWPAGRAVKSGVVVRIDAIEKERGGLFGLRRSESMADHLPDPVTLKASVLASDDPAIGSRIAIRLPQVELKGIGPGDEAVVGLVEDESKPVCICIARRGSQIGETDIASSMKDGGCGRY